MEEIRDELRFQMGWMLKKSPDEKVQCSSQDSGYNSVFSPSFSSSITTSSDDIFSPPSTHNHPDGSQCSVQSSSAVTPFITKSKLKLSSKSKFQRWISEPNYDPSMKEKKSTVFSRPLLSSTPRYRTDSESTDTEDFPSHISDLSFAPIVENINFGSTSSENNLFSGNKSLARSKSESSVSEIPYTSTPIEKSGSIHSLNIQLSEIKCAQINDYQSQRNKIQRLNDDSLFIKPISINTPVELRRNFEKSPSKSKHKNLCTKSPRKALRNLRKPKIPFRFLTQPRNILVGLYDHAPYLLPYVLRYLPNRDIVTLSHVNKKLRELIESLTPYSKKRLFTINAAKNNCVLKGKENCTFKRIDPDTDFALSSPRKHLSLIQNTMVHSGKSPVKPVSLFDRFVKAGEKLKPGQYQQKCARCKNPATVYPEESRAKCTFSNCEFNYCIKCFLEFHTKPEDCPTLKPRTSSKVTKNHGLFSKASKKRLRRL